MTSEQVLLTEDRDGLRTLTLNRPDRKNAINAQLWEELADALRAAARDTELRTLVITGAAGAFCRVAAPRRGAVRCGGVARGAAGPPPRRQVRTYAA
jgi:enoyl-CoA hydratase/carnithine racemase